MKLKSVILGLASLSLLTSLSAADKKVYRLKLASSFEKTMPILGSQAKNFANLVEKMSDGRLIIRVDEPSKHKAGLAVMDMVKNNQYDIGYTVSYYYKGKDFKLVFFTTVPFGMTPTEQQAWYSFGGGKELAQKAYAKHNLLSFNGGNTGVQMGGWFRKEIKSLEDLKGLKVRIPGLGGEVMARTGVAAVTVPLGELYMALETGTIDAVEWVSPVFDLSMGFHKIAKYYYTGWQEPASETQFLINKKSYAKLPKDLQVILESAIDSVASKMYQEATYQNAEAWAKITNEYKDIKVLSFPPEIMAALKKASDEILEEQAKKDPDFKEILDSQRAFMQKARAWTKIGDYAYIDKASK